MASRGVTAQLHQMFVADFETCDTEKLYRVDEEGNKIYYQRVWLAGVKSLDTMKSLYFTNLDDFMSHILSRQDNTNREYGFHNLKFDGSFIIPWLFDNGYICTHGRPKKGEFSVLIDERNNWYNIVIQVTTKRKVTLWDTAKLFPMQLEYLHEIYGTPTQKIHEDEEFYNRVRPEHHEPTSDELKYMENDLAVLAETLKAHIKLYGLRFKKTQAGQAFYNFEQHFKAWKLRFPPLDIEVDKLIRPAYWGGISHVNPEYAGKDMYDIDVYDINSSYPYQLAYKKMPYGNMLSKSEGEEPDMSKFWIAEVVVRFKLKPNCLPCIPTKSLIEGKYITNDKWLSDSRGLVRMRLCCIDLLNMSDSYDFEVIKWEWVMHWAWKVHPELTSYILQNNHDKEHYRQLARAEQDSELKKEYLAKAQRAKINNNAFYGKFGEDVIKLGKTPHLENGEVIYKVDTEDIQTEHKRKFLPVAMATTAWGRRQLVKMANLVGDKFIYCDTDSVHVLSEGSKIIEDNANEGNLKLSKLDLGAWDFEGHYDRGRFLRAKCYYEQKEDEDAEVTLAGLPADPHSGQGSKKRSVITWDNFHIGLKIPADKTNKLGTRRTPTGNKLVPVPFEIKIKDNFH